jgi:hypothetical protein
MTIATRTAPYAAVLVRRGELGGHGGVAGQGTK